MCSCGSQYGVWCVSVHRFRCESGLNFYLNSHPNRTQTRTGPLWNAARSCPGHVWTGSIKTLEHSQDMQIGCGETPIKFAHIWTWPKNYILYNAYRFRDEWESVLLCAYTAYSVVNLGTDLQQRYFFVWLLLIQHVLLTKTQKLRA